MAWRWCLPAALASCAQAARAHALQDRYDLPLPMAYVVAGACAVVVLTFLLAAFFARPAQSGGVERQQRIVPVPRALVLVLRVLAVLVLLVTLAAALWGTQDPLMNIAPTMVWIVAWLGLTFACAFALNVWPLVDPWRALAGDRSGVLRWPQALGCWPAVLLLLAWSWVEIVYPIASSPRKLGWVLLAWSVITVSGMLLFGRRNWQAHADVFAITFATFGRMPRWRLQIADAAGSPRGLVAFVMALLATVIFDGLHSAPAWSVFEAALRKLHLPLDVNGYLAGTTGLLVVWLAFVVFFEGALHGPLRQLRSPLALTLLPIAAGYAVAHNLTTFVLQGQRVFALVSDPFGRQWDLFGTARFYPDISVIDARATWFIAVIAIVGGHAASIWWSHRVVLSAGIAPRRTAIALLPLTLLMVAFTALSLLLLAAADG